MAVNGLYTTEELLPRGLEEPKASPAPAPPE
jgi:hypothetical protein